MKWRLLIALAILPFMCLVGRASAQSLLITVDENGNGIGTVGPGFLAPDPGPGGLPLVLTYRLPFTTVVGDVSMTDAEAPPEDTLRFNGTTLLFYSIGTDGMDSLTDLAPAPTAFYTNHIFIPEVGTEGNNGAFYTPVAGQPGFVAGSSVTYHFISDGVVPEPGSLALTAALSMTGFAFVFSRRLRQPKL